MSSRLDKQAAFRPVHDIVAGRSVEGLGLDIRRMFGRSTPALVKRSEGIEQLVARHGLRPIFPLHGDGLFAVSRRGHSVVLQAVGARARTVSVQGGKISYSEAWPSTDLLYTASHDGIEEFLLLRDRNAPTRFEYDIVSTAGVGVPELHDGAVHFLDKRGKGLKVEAPYLVDAEGRHTEEAVHWSIECEDEVLRLVLNLDAEGLSYPIAIDPSWTTVGRTREVHWLNTGTVLRDGRTLIAGGGNAGADPRNCEIYEPTTRTWRFTTKMNDGRSEHTATLLDDGRVLAVGGGINSAEIFDPIDESWTLVASSNRAHVFHSSVRLPDGRVLVNAEEIYDPALDTWTMNTAPGFAMGRATLARLLDGRVLAIHGENPNTITPQIFDHVSESWTPTAAPVFLRIEASATTLADGRVLFAGGADETYTPVLETEVWDPTTGAWSFTSPIGIGRYWHGSTLLADGRVLMSGGYDAGFDLIDSWEIYDPLTASWSENGTMGEVHGDVLAPLLPTGQVLVQGGLFGEIELFDPRPDNWQTTTNLLSTEYFLPQVVLLPDQRVLVAGDSSADLFDPATASFSLAAAPPGDVDSILLLKDGRVLGASSSAHLYDPATDSWTSVTNPTGYVPHLELLSDGRAFGVSSLFDPATELWSTTNAPPELGTEAVVERLDDGRVLVLGGRIGLNEYTNRAWVYDPFTSSWSELESMVSARADAASAALADGRVLVVGGATTQILNATETWSPLTRTWSMAGPLPLETDFHASVVLPDFRVMTVGGREDTFRGSPSARVHVFEPATSGWTQAADLPTPRGEPGAVLLADDRVLVVGGTQGPVDDLSGSLYENGIDDARRPLIASVSGSISAGGTVSLSGSGFLGDSGGSTGGTRSSDMDHPILRLRSLHRNRLYLIAPDPASPVTDSLLRTSVLPDGLDPGLYHLHVIASGVPSLPVTVEIECGVVFLGQPASTAVALGESATFHVDANGIRRLQWQRSLDGTNWSDIPGANANSYETPPTGPADAGTLYRAVVTGPCTDHLSAEAVLQLLDSSPPLVDVLSPDGGEYWLLADNPFNPNEEVVGWEMSDDIRVCGVKVDLEHSNDGGTMFELTETLLDEQLGPGCTFPGITQTVQFYELLDTPPSGTPGSLYQVRVTVSDQADNSSEATSERPFFIVAPNLDSVRTLIVHDIERMKAPAGGGVSAAQGDALLDRLRELAGHPRVQGAVIDLDAISASLDPLFASWDADRSNLALGNEILFGPGGIHEYLLDLAEAPYSGVESIILVGDDRVIPFARILDQTTLLDESSYASSGALRPGGSSVADVLDQNHFLSDDAIGSLDAVSAAELNGDPILPDLNVGRLVETPEQIGSTIARFISQDGTIDLTQIDPVSGHVTLVSGYDFLEDSARRIRARWKAKLGDPGDDSSLAPVDGSLIGADWGLASVAERTDALLEHLGGNGAERYAVVSLNGHATHFEEGVPDGSDPFAVQGLDSAQLASLDLAGSIVYSVGCHGGLPVPNGDPTDNPLDLPEAMLARGAVVYAANTGFGWGLRQGIGYSERLVELFTEELTSGGTVSFGQAFRRAKTRYVLESPRLDDYDRKSVAQWAVFGLPMYAVRTGISNALAEPTLYGPSLHPMPGPERDELYMNGVLVGRQGSGDLMDPVTHDLPAFVTQLNLNFDLSAPGVYRKWKANGDPELAPAGCTDPDGCYYTLNGQVERSTGVADLPLQPYLIFDSRLAGTSQHGVLWMGQDYVEESGWIPVIGQLQSNQDCPLWPSDPGCNGAGGIPRTLQIGPVGRSLTPLRDPIDCAATDVSLNSLVLTTGQALKDQLADPVHDRQRLASKIDVEVLYYNNSIDGDGNCDDVGPTIDAPLNPGTREFHVVTPTEIEWQVEASDASGAWRVVVVWDDLTNGRWQALELEPDCEGCPTSLFTGSIPRPPQSRLTYTVQAVDNTGNVSMLEFETTDFPTSGQAHGIVDPIDVDLFSGPDTDGDGAVDSWEELHGLDPNDASDGPLDPDHDGLSNVDEYLNGADPNDQDSDDDGDNDGSEVSDGRRPTLAGDARQLTILVSKSGNDLLLSWPDSLGENARVRGYHRVYANDSAGSYEAADLAHDSDPDPMNDHAPDPAGLDTMEWTQVNGLDAGGALVFFRVQNLLEL